MSMNKIFTFSFFLILPLLLTAQQHVKLEMMDCFLDDCSVLNKFPDIEFGYLTVPEDYDAPDGNLVKVAFAIVRSREEIPEPDPVLIFQGGFSSPILRQIGTMAEVFQIKNRDMILFDYRGVGYSSPILCPGIGQKQYDVFIQDLRFDELNESMYAIAKECMEILKEQGIDYRQYGNEIRTKDAVVLIEQLGYEEVNLSGISNGTIAIQGFIRGAEDSNITIRSVMSDSNVPMHYNTKGNLILHYKNVLNNIFQDCEGNPKCAAAFPKLKDRFYHFLQQMEDKSIALSGSDQNIFLDRYKINTIIHLLLNSTTGYKDFPIVLEAIMARKVDFLDRILETMKTILTTESGAGLINFVYDVNSTQDEIRASVTKNSTEFPEFKMASHYLHFLLNDTTMGFNPRDTIPVKSDVPVLLLAGSYDPVTPPEFSEVLHERYTNSHYFELSKTGHAAVFSPCGEELYLAFTDNPTQKPPADCVEELLSKEIPFTTSYYSNQKIANLIIEVYQNRNIKLIIAIVLPLLLSIILFLRHFVFFIRKNPFSWIQLILPAAIITFFGYLIYSILQTVNAGGFLVLLGLVASASFLPWLALLIMILLLIGILQLLKSQKPTFWNVGMLVSAGLTIWIAITYQLIPF